MHVHDLAWLQFAVQPVPLDVEKGSAGDSYPICRVGVERGSGSVFSGFSIA